MRKLSKELFAGLILALALLAPCAAFSGEDECAIDCWTVVPTVTMAGAPTNFKGYYTSPCTEPAMFAWDFGDGSPAKPWQYSERTFETPGTYNWTFTVTVAGATCTRRGSILVTPYADGCGFDGTSPPQGLSILGDAAAVGSSLSLTPDEADKRGAAWCMQMPNLVNGFEASFRFRINHAACECSDAGADGFALVINRTDLEKTSALGEGGSGLGYRYIWGLALEFDTYENAEMGDPNGNHIALMKNRQAVGLTANHQEEVASNSAVPELADGQVHLARFVYVPGNFKLYLDDSRTPVIDHDAMIEDLLSLYLGQAWVGFTAATAAEWESHEILDWSFTSGAPSCSLVCSASVPDSATLNTVSYFLGNAGPTHCTGEPSYLWDFGDGGTSTDQNPSYIYRKVGRFTWTLTVSVDDKSCAKSGEIEVSGPCTLACDASASVDHGDKPLEVAFSSTTTQSNCADNLTVAWDFGDGTTSAEQSPVHTYTTSGSFTWTFTALSGEARCTKSGTILVESGLPGDCDGSGTVSIGEVQRVINMFLGAAAPDCGADCDGNGQVSIGEVQKVINGFLGNPSSC